jgi:hypothetical protein
MPLKKAWVLAAICAIGLSVTLASAEVGVTADTIRIGQVCALTGPARGLVRSCKQAPRPILSILTVREVSTAGKLASSRWTIVMSQSKLSKQRRS